MLDKVEDATPLAARTARFVASSTSRLILTKSKKTAGSMGRGRGVLKFAFARVSRISGGSCSQGPWKEEMYRQCLPRGQSLSG